MIPTHRGQMQLAFNVVRDLEESLPAQYRQRFVRCEAVQKSGIALCQMLMCVAGGCVDRSLGGSALLSLTPAQVLGFFVGHR